MHSTCVGNSGMCVLYHLARISFSSCVYLIQIGCSQYLLKYIGCLHKYIKYLAIHLSPPICQIWALNLIVAKYSFVNSGLIYCDYVVYNFSCSGFAYGSQYIVLWCFTWFSFQKPVAVFIPQGGFLPTQNKSLTLKIKEVYINLTHVGSLVCQNCFVT